MAKYTPLGVYLSRLIANVLTMSFEDVECVIEASLPPSAHNHREWWANDTTGFHPHATVWLNAGWRVDAVSLSGRWVRFSRVV